LQYERSDDQGRTVVTDGTAVSTEAAQRSDGNAGNRAQRRAARRTKR